MKKITMMAMMAVATTTVFAQSDVVKNAKKLLDKGDVEEAIKAVQPALNEGTAEDKAAAWNLLSTAQYKKFSDIQGVKLENQLKQTNNPVDEPAMHQAAIASLEAALKCDEYDSQPNEKGKVKPKFRAENQKTYQNGRLQCINAGQYLYQEKDYAGAFKAFSLYVDSGDSPLFTGIDMSKDQYKNEVAYFASLSAYQAKDYDNVIKYAQIAAQDTAKAKDATEILVFSKRETMKTPQDTLEYISMLKDACQKFPEDTRYSAWIGDYYLNSNKTDELLKWAESEIAKNPGDKFGYTYKGEALRMTGKFDEAVECYKKAFEIDPTYIAAAYQAGVSLNSKAIEMKDQLADKKTGKLTVENANKIKAILSDAKVYLEKVRELDPERKTVNWAYALYQMYYSLGDNEKASELESLVGGGN
jgi:tetratricopeptide (TPR) repeat protein